MNEMLPVVWPDAPNVRASHPVESHIAADRAVKRVPTVWAVRAALRRIGSGTSGQVWEAARAQGFLCTPQRVRSVLAEEDEFVAREGGVSEYGNPARVWSIKGES